MPEGWAWCRLNQIYNFIDYRGVTPNKIDSGVPLVTAKNVKNGYIDYSISEFISKADYEKRQGRGSPRKGDLLFTTEAPLGNCAIADLDIFSPGQRIITFQQYTNTEFLNNKLFLYFILSDKFQELIYNKRTGTTVTGIKAEKLKLIFIPLPPKKEQDSIVSVIENIYLNINSIEKSKLDLQEIIKQTKSKILDLAIHGKLVPQDPTDEPAEELLKRIATSDNRPYKKFDGEEPFDIPNSWSWSSMKDIVTINPKNKIDDYTYVSFIPMTLIDSEYKNAHGQEERLWKDIKKGFTHFAENDVAIAKISPCFENRKSVVLKNLKNGYGAGTTELYILRSKEGVLSEYILWLVKSDNFINTGVGNFSGVVGQQRLARDVVENYPIPLPPLTEQRRIVAKIEELFKNLDEILQNLSV